MTDQTGDIDVLDLGGRRVRLVDSGVGSDAVTTRVWNGRDADGARLRSAVYWAWLSAGERRWWRRFVMLESQ